MSELPPVAVTLMNLDVPHNIFEHSRPPLSLEQAAEERGQSPEQIVRSILFRVSESEYVMVLIAGPTQISWKSLRKHLGVNRLSLASKEEVLIATGYQLGSVAPFGLSHPIKILIDDSVLGQPVISIGSGVRGTAIILNSKDLIDALEDCEIVHFRSP